MILHLGFKTPFLFRIPTAMNKIPIGEWIQKFVELLTNRYETEFRLFSDFLNDRLGLLIQLLAQIRPELVILFIVGVVYLKKRNWKNVFLSLLGLLTILNLGYWRETLETALLVTVATHQVDGGCCSRKVKNNISANLC